MVVAPPDRSDIFFFPSSCSSREGEKSILAAFHVFLSLSPLPACSVLLVDFPSSALHPGPRPHPPGWSVLAVCFVPGTCRPVSQALGPPPKSCGSCCTGHYRFSSHLVPPLTHQPITTPADHPARRLARLGTCPPRKTIPAGGPAHTTTTTAPQATGTTGLAARYPAQRFPHSPIPLTWAANPVCLCTYTCSTPSPRTPPLPFPSQPSRLAPTASLLSTQRLTKTRARQHGLLKETEAAVVHCHFSIFPAYRPRLDRASQFQSSQPLLDCSLMFSTDYFST